MARELRDVLHYFIEEPAPRQAAEPVTRHGSVLVVPVGERNVVHGAFAWNLAAELSRGGAPVVVVAPADQDAGPPWAGLGAAGPGVRFVPSFARDLPELASTVRAVGDPGEGPAALSLVLVPAPWVEDAAGEASAEGVLDWSLVFTTPDGADLRRALRLVRVLGSRRSARVGVTVHGVRRLEEARDAFLRLAEVAERHLGRGLLSYGLLLDDLDVYRAIVEQRALGAVRPQSRAARALRDVARLIREDLHCADE